MLKTPTDSEKNHIILYIHERYLQPNSDLDDSFRALNQRYNFNIAIEDRDDYESTGYRPDTGIFPECRVGYNQFSLGIHPLLVRSIDWLTQPIGSFYSSFGVFFGAAWLMDGMFNAFVCSKSISRKETLGHLFTVATPYAITAVAYTISSNPLTASVAGTMAAIATHANRSFGLRLGERTASLISNSWSTLFGRRNNHHSQMNTGKEQQPLMQPALVLPSPAPF